MSKKLFAILLIAVMLCGVFAAAPVASADGTEEAPDYRTLYVQDGLTVLLDAYQPDATLDLQAGTWSSVLNDGKGADLLTKGGVTWTLGKDGKGVKYAMTFAQWNTVAPNGAADPEVGISLDPSLLSGNYTVEFVADMTGLINEDGTPYRCADPNYKWGVFSRNYSGFTLGYLKAVSFVCDVDKTAEGMGGATANALRWFYHPLEWADDGGNKNGYTLAVSDCATNPGSILTNAVTFDGTEWNIYQGSSRVVNFCPATTTKADLQAQGYLSGNGSFHLMYGHPGTMYSVRVYDRALTAEERQQNYFIDLAAYSGLDLTAYAAADAETKAKIHVAVASTSIGATAEMLEVTMEKYLGGGTQQEEEADLSGSLYVTDGLSLLLTAFRGEENVSVANGTGLWRAQTGQRIGLTGDTWFCGENGGVGYTLNIGQYRSGKAAGLVLDPSMIPEGSYTVEMVLSAAGVTEADGSRFVDMTSNYGTYHVPGIAVGPLKTNSFVTLRKESATDGYLENRWIYIAQGGWQECGCKSRLTEYTFRTENTDDVFPYSFTHELGEIDGKKFSKYAVYSGANTVGSFTIGADEYKTVEESEGYFYLMYRYPATYYAVRLYDRVLTEAERNQNHTADLIYYYGLDTQFLQMTAMVVDNMPEIYASLAGVGFRMTKEEAQQAFNDALSKVWITSLGLSARLDKVGVRAVFRVPDSTVTALEGMGYRVEIGVGFSAGKAETLNACESRIVVYGESGKNSAFYLDDGTFAFAVDYRCCGAAEYIREVTFIGYITVYGEDGNVLYDLPCVVQPDGFALSPFGLYSALSFGDYAGNAFVKKMVNSCFVNKDLYVDAASAASGDGSEASPFAGVEEAYAALVALLRQTAVPTEYTLHLGEGVHRTSQPLTFDAAAYDKTLVRINVVGAGAEETTLTGNRVIDTAANPFRAVSGQSYYELQLPKEGSAYPEFRFLYVNGKIAELAHRGPTRALNEDQYITPYTWTKNNLYATNVPLECKMYLASELFVGLTEEDWKTLEVHMEVQWKFNILKVDYVDWDDMLDDGKYVAVHFDPEQYNRMCGPSGEDYDNRPYWLENSLGCLDEPGEYFYDQENGKLYYYPLDGEDITKSVFEIPTVENLFMFFGTSQTTIADMTLTGVDHLHTSKYGYCAGQAGGESKYGYLTLAAIRADNVEHFTLRDCILENIAGDGLNMRGRLRDIKVDSNRFFNVGATAIRVGVYGITKWTEANSIIGLSVTNNYLDGIAWYLRESDALLVSQAVNVEILYNTIKNCCYSAMSIGVQAGAAKFTHEDNVYNLCNVEIAYNYITDFMTDMRDGGAIYTLGGNAERDYTEPLNSIHENYIVWSKITGDAQGKAHTTGIYNDNCSSNWEDYYNVQVLNPNRYWKGMYFMYVQRDEVHSISVEDNYFVWCGDEDQDKLMEKILFNILPKEDEANPGTNPAEKDVHESGTTLYRDFDEVDDGVLFIIGQAGSSFCLPDVNDIAEPTF